MTNIKYVLAGLTLVAIILAMFLTWTTVERAMMDYNENGVYFDKGTVVTYRSQSTLVYAIMAGLSLLLSAGMIIKTSTLCRLQVKQKDQKDKKKHE